jgi:large subunit ribosomal protein L30
MAKRLIVIRIRGSVNVNRKIENTLRMLNLERVNNAVFIDDRESYRGMLQIVKDYVTWGEVDTEDVSLILKNRGNLIGNERLSDDYMKENTEFKSIDAFSKAFLEFKTELSDVHGLKTVFRLHPPRKGHGGIKKAFSLGGALGYRDTKIKELIVKMR